MTPEEIITAFVQVSEDNAAAFSPEAESNLDSLADDVAQLKGEPNQAVADAIQAWCRKYPHLAKKVLDAARRKPKPRSADPSKQSGLLENRQPELYKELSDRVSSSAEPKPDGA